MEDASRQRHHHPYSIQHSHGVWTRKEERKKEKEKKRKVGKGEVGKEGEASLLIHCRNYEYTHL